MKRIQILLLSIFAFCSEDWLLVQGRRLARPKHISDFGLQLPGDILEAEAYEGAIVQELSRLARLAEAALLEYGDAFDSESHMPEEACCIISKLPLLVREAGQQWVAGPWGLAAIVAPAANSKIRVNIYRTEALARWYCSHFTDPLIGGAVGPSTQVFKLSDDGSPLCSSDIPATMNSGYVCQPQWRVSENDRLQEAVASNDITNLYWILPTLDDRTVQCIDAHTGRSVLHFAVGAERPYEHVLTLLTRIDNFTVGARTRGGWTALHLAVSFGCRRVLRAILQKTNSDALNAAIASPSDYHHGNAGDTALHLAVFRGDARIVKTLAEKMELSTLNMRNCDGRTALHLAMQFYNVNVVKELAPRMDPAGLSLLDNFGWTALHSGVRVGSAEAVEALLSTEGGQTTLNITTNMGYTALHLAAKFAEIAVMRVLLKYMSAAAVSARSQDGMTALILAFAHAGETFRWSSNGRAAEIVLVLLGRMEYASITSCDSAGRTALHWLVISDFLMIDDARHRNVEAASALLSTFRINEARGQDRRGRTALHYAAEAGIHFVVAAFLDRYDRGAAELQDVEGATALHLACGAGHVKVVQELLRAKVDLDQVDNAGDTAIERARKAGRDAVLHLLGT